MAQIFGDFGKFAALEQAEKNAFDRGKDVAHLADDDPLQAGYIQAIGNLGINLLQVKRYHQAATGILDLIGDLALGIKRVEIDNDAAAFQHGIVADHVIRCVGQAQPDLVAFTHAELMKAFGDAIDLSGNVFVVVNTTQEIKTWALGKTLCRIIKNLVNRAHTHWRADIDTVLQDRRVLDVYLVHTR